MSRPGVMLYFDFRPGLKRLPPEQRCVVYEAILDYAEFGEIPCFDDPASEMFWEMIRPRLDADAEAYMQKVEKRRNAANTRWNAHESITMQMDANAQDALEKKKKRNTTEIEKEIEREIVIKADKPPARHKYGSYKNVLFTDEEYTKLKAEFPADYSERIERLSEYIASTGKTYKSHIATIRSWARKEGAKGGAMPNYGGEENWSL